METKKITVGAILLVFGMMLILGFGKVKEVDAARKICPEICYAYLDYMTCPSSGYQKLTASCSCCMAPENGCTLYFTNGNAPIVC